MTLEIVFPLEFIVRGLPVSAQTKTAGSRARWMGTVREASRAVLPEGHFVTSDSVGVTLFYFPRRPMQGDVDNIVKPVLDALTRHIYLDDHQVERVWVQKFEPFTELDFDNPSDTLREALAAEGPVLYIRLTSDLAEGLP